MIALGIDAGGTYTDAALVELAEGRILAGAKALTSHYDLSVGIRESLDAVFAGRHAAPADVSLVGLSTTLATNAIVEGRGSPISLLLIGYDPDLIRQYGFERDLVTADVVYLNGGHDAEGNEVVPLDEAAAREAILARRGRVEALAVSGYFGVRNPTHELRLRALVEELTSDNGTPLPVTCGHELTSRLNAIRRATTAALNARLVPLLQDLIATVRRTLDVLGVSAPLMVVKGDGSLVRAEWARRRPIETILSGPAASVVGAWYLAGRGDAWVVDVGGTTTDIAALRGGHPRLNPQGAQVGCWRTMVEAVDVHTVGLGGDSLVQLHDAGRLTIGPRRVIPLCLLASEHPGVVDQLRLQVNGKAPYPGQFVLVQPGRPTPGLAEQDRVLLEQLSGGPKSLAQVVELLRYNFLVQRQLERLEERRLLLRAGFTPSDALHVLGRFNRWDGEAARLGAQLLASQAGLAPQELCEQVVAGVSNRVTRELVTKVLADESATTSALSTDGQPLPDWERQPAAAALLARALGQQPTSELGCRLTLQHPLVAVGAPVGAYLPRTAQDLHTTLVIPEHAEVGNAVGAVAGGVLLQQHVLIQPLGADSLLRLHLPDGVRDFGSLAEAVTCAHQVVPPRLHELAHQAGADQVEIQVNRLDHQAPVKGGWGDKIYLGTELTFRAVGRPALGHNLERKV